MVLGRGADVEQRELVVAPHFLEQRNADAERLAGLDAVLGGDVGGAWLGVRAETPSDGVGDELGEVRVGEIGGVAKRCVKCAVALEAVRPRDRLGGMALDRAGEQRLGRLGQRRVFVKRTSHFEFGSDAAEDRMPLGRRHDGGVAGQIIFVVAVVVAAEDELVELEPVLDRVAGGAQADDRFAGLDVSFHLAKLFGGELHAAREDDHEIGLAKRVEAREAVFPLANNRGAAVAVLPLKLRRELGQRARRAVQRLAAEQDDVRLGFGGLKVGRAQKK